MFDLMVSLICVVIIIFCCVMLVRDLEDIINTLKAEYPKKGIISEGIEKAKQDLAEAEQDFNYAAKEYIDIATYKLKAAEEKFKTELLQKRIG